MQNLSVNSTIEQRNLEKLRQEEEALGESMEVDLVSVQQWEDNTSPPASAGATLLEANKAHQANDASS